DTICRKVGSVPKPLYLRSPISSGRFSISNSPGSKCIYRVLQLISQHQILL
ncbi:Hypothetical predicted protein, partial [Paramuricea clavata]